MMTSCVAAIAGARSAAWRSASIPYADLATVCDPDSFKRSVDRPGFLVPRGEGVEMTAATWVHAKWAFCDRPDLASVRGFYCGGGKRGLLDRSDADMLGLFCIGVTDRPAA